MSSKSGIYEFCRQEWQTQAKKVANCREVRSRPVSRVLSGARPAAIIHLGPSSPTASCDLPESAAGHDIAFLFGLAPGGVYLAAACCHLRGALLPHHFTLTWPVTAGRYAFCCTFRGLTSPRRYLAPCPAEPGLSSPSRHSRDGAIARPTPGRIVAQGAPKTKALIATHSLDLFTNWAHKSIKLSPTSAQA